MVTSRGRGAGRLDQEELPELLDPSAEALTARIGGPERMILVGGEPTLRIDLPEVVATVADLTPPLLRTDGLGLTSPEVIRPLVRAGLAGVRIPLHCGRRDAHDWLVERPGAARAVVRAIRACVGLGLRVEVEITATRPTVAHLAETVALVARLGVAAVRIRRLLRRGPAAGAYVALSPRLGLITPHLEAAVAVGGVDVELEGFPRCAAGEARDRLRPTDASRLVAVDAPGWSAVTAKLSPPPAVVRCGICPGPPACPGLCAGHLDLFGDVELDRSEEPTA